MRNSQRRAPRRRDYRKELARAVARLAPLVFEYAANQREVNLDSWPTGNGGYRVCASVRFHDDWPLDLDHEAFALRSLAEASTGLPAVRLDILRSMRTVQVTICVGPADPDVTSASFPAAAATETVH